MADYHLLGNGINLYRRSSHLVRTPIAMTITLAPDAGALYAVAGSYNSDTPTAGVVGSNGWNEYTRIIEAGKNMRKLYLGTKQSTGRQIWRSTFEGYTPRFVFYHGSYATSTSSPYYKGEAFMQIPAYHFTIPQEYKDFSVDSISLRLTHGGTILKYGSPKIITYSNFDYFAKEAPLNLLEANNEWRDGWEQEIGAFSSLDDHVPNMHPIASQYSTLATDLIQGTLNRGENYNAYQLWGNTFVKYTDGSIPQTDSPWTQAIKLNSQFNDAIKSDGGIWFVIRPNVSTSTLEYEDNQNDYPFYYPNSADAGYWICCSYWGYSLSVSLSI